MKRRLLAQVFFVVGLLSGCGRENVDLALDAGSSLTDASGDSTCAPAALCHANGGQCSVAADCCSSRCESGVCLAPGTCAGPRAACSTRSLCCSGRCESDDGTSRVCQDYCLAVGANCDDGRRCCSLSCTNGTCGGAACTVVGQACMEDKQCCSKSCEDGHCAIDGAGCRRTGESCGADGGNECCSGACNAAGRCDLGPGPCREESSPCVQDSDCCRGSCLADATGTLVCTAPCLTDGKDCNGGGDCCSGVCGGTPSTCQRACPAP